jgi:hypothetical protein
MSEAAYPRLFHLFGAYMHQDWGYEGNDWRDLVQNYAKEANAADLKSAADEIDRLLADFSDDAALRDELYRELCCYYDPRPDLGGPTVRAWLGQVAQYLRSAAGHTISHS